MVREKALTVAVSSKWSATVLTPTPIGTDPQEYGAFPPVRPGPEVHDARVGAGTATAAATASAVQACLPDVLPYTREPPDP